MASLQNLLLLSFFTTAHVVLAATPTQLGRAQDQKACVDLGFPRLLTWYRQALPLHKDSADQAPDCFLPFYGSQPLQTYDRNVKTAIIFMHGAGAHANLFFCMAAAASTAVTGTRGAITIVPWFGNEQVLAGDWLQGSRSPVPEGIQSSTRSLWWRTQSWASGGSGSMDPKFKDTSSKQLTSFGALDALIGMLQNRTVFPNLNVITISGFSAGGQTVQKYAWSTKVGTPGPKDGKAAAIRFIPVSPGTYVYLSEKRPAAQCSPLRNTGADWTCQDYDVPTNVEGYNDWKYGTVIGDGTGPYLEEAALAVPERTQAYGQKTIVYMLGPEDACNCQVANYTNADFCFQEVTCKPPVVPLYENCCDTFPDSASSNLLDVKPQAMLQGSNRLQRGLNFANSLPLIFPKPFKPKVVVIDGMGHDVAELLTSPEWAQYAYDKDIDDVNNS